MIKSNDAVIRLNRTTIVPASASRLNGDEVPSGGKIVFLGQPVGSNEVRSKAKTIFIRPVYANRIQDFRGELVEYFLEEDDLAIKSAEASTLSYQAKIASIVDGAHPIKSTFVEPNAEVKDELLRNYLRALAEYEALVFEISESLSTLLSIRDSFATKGIKNRMRVIDILKSANKNILDKQIERLQDTRLLEETLGIRVGIPERPEVLLHDLEKPTLPEKPERPSILEAALEEPREPDYVKPLFLNRKRNEELMRGYKRAVHCYENDLQKQTEAQKLYEEALSEYQSAVDGFDKLMQKYEQQCAQRDEALRRYDIDVAEYHKKMDELREKAADGIRRNQAEHDSSFNHLDSIIELHIGVYNALIEDTKKALEEAAATLKGMYDHNIVFPKYRNLPAISTMYEYLASGRCAALEGPDGAYNLYESEIRANRVISKLEDIDGTLDAIKESQFVLYSSLQGVRKDLLSVKKTIANVGETIARVGSEIVDGVNEMTKTVDQHGQSATATLGEIGYQVSATRMAAQEIARNTEIGAYWAQKNAELTDSLGYMIAFSSIG